VEQAHYIVEPVLVAYLHAFLGFFPTGTGGHLLVPLLFLIIPPILLLM
jgi:hypothetical protein